MPVAVDEPLPLLEDHRHCFACSPTHPKGLRLQFSALESGSVFCEASLGDDYQSFDGIVHGGIVATMLDTSMGHCLYQQNIRALTAHLDIRYKRPLLTETPFRIEARLKRERSPLYELESSIVQNNHLIASARGRFMIPTDYFSNAS